jgi:hypothetical protein
LISQLRAITQTNHRTPKKIVIRSRFRSTTEDEPRVEDTPPPNKSDSPPPLPLCSKTSRIITKLVMIRITETPTTIAVIHLPLMTCALLIPALLIPALLTSALSTPAPLGAPLTLAYAANSRYRQI